MPDDRHVDCLQERSFDCPHCGRYTKYNTAEFLRCVRCGFTPGASLSSAVAETHAAGQLGKQRSAGAKLRHAIKRMHPVLAQFGAEVFKVSA